MTFPDEGQPLLDEPDLHSTTSEPLPQKASSKARQGKAIMPGNFTGLADVRNVYTPSTKVCVG